VANSETSFDYCFSVKASGVA